MNDLLLLKRISTTKTLYISLQPRLPWTISRSIRPANPEGFLAEMPVVAEFQSMVETLLDSQSINHADSESLPAD
jgi:hypothetical protein